MKKPTNVRVAFVLAFILSPAVHAATWHVRAGASGDGSAEVTDFYVNDAVGEDGFWPGDNANSGASPESPMASISLLLNRYPDIGAGCTVHVAPGVYPENICIGPERSGLVLIGAGPGASIIDGGQQASCVILDCPEVALDGFTIRNGKGFGRGGGITCLSGSPVISNNHITGNSGGGGSLTYAAAAISCVSCSPLIVQNVIADNAPAYDYCGGLYCFDSPAVVTSNVFAGNFTKGYGDGGAIGCAGAATLVVAGNEVTGNKAYQGATILSSAPIILTGNVICDNASSSSIGYSSAVLCSATAMITDNTFIGNDGTAITCKNCEVSIARNTISQNETGIIGTSASGTVENNTIFANGTGIDWIGIGTISGNVLSGNTGTAIVCDIYKPSLSVVENTIVENYRGINCSGNTTVVENVISRNGGSGVGAAVVECSTGAIFTNNVVMNNHLPSGRTITCKGGTLIGNTIVDNTASKGGGIYCGGAGTITGNTIARNSAGYGGGICVQAEYAYATPFITENTIESNAANYGGGIAVLANILPTITGNTISGNIIAASSSGSGAGIYCNLGGITANGNVISHNGPAGHVAVVLDDPSNATFSGNIVIANEGMGLSYRNVDSSARLSFSGDSIIANRGTGLYCSSSVASVSNCLIVGNGGYGIRALSSELSIENSTVAGNGSSTTPAMSCEQSSDVVVWDSIFWRPAGATGSVITVGDIWSGGGDLTISYSDINGGKANISLRGDSYLYWFPGNISLDPLFADPADGDYHLESRYGRWDPAANDGAGAWVNDGATSPCIDAGDPASPCANEPQPNFGRVNMGAYGNTEQASKSRWSIVADVNDDCIVNILDLIFIRGRLNQPLSTGDNWKADANDDGRINILDLIFVRGKLASTCK